MKQKLLAMMFALLAVQATVWAQTDSGYCGDPNVNEGKDVTWVLVDSTVTISGTGAMADYSLKNRSPWFGSNAIKRVIIEQGVTSVGDRCFYRCSSLTDVTIPNTVKSLASGSFYDCKSLQNLSIDMDSISGKANMLSSFVGISNLTIGRSVVSIDVSNIFKNFENLTNIVVNEGNAVYDSRDNCNAIIEKATNSLILGGGNTVIPNSVTSVGDMAFYRSMILECITIPSSVTSIGEGAFERCSSLDSVVCLNPVPPTLGENSFSGISRNAILKVADVEKYMASDWSKWFKVFVDSNDTAGGVCGNSATWRYANGKLTISGTGEVTKGSWDAYNFTEVEIKEGVTHIGHSAFKDCTVLRNVIIPNTILQIRTSAFSGCSSLASINVPEGVTNIGYSAFEGCSSLASINIPEGVTDIKENAFRGCSSLTSIIIPEGVKNIGIYAFEGCTSLTSIVIPNSVRVIGQGAFEWCEKLANITLPDSIRTIDSSTFKGCYRLSNIIIPESVTNIREWAFSSCESLEKIVIPNSVTFIGQGAFIRCVSLTELTIGRAVTSIFEGAFSYCSGLSTIKVDEGNTVYDSRNNCNALIETAKNYLIVGCKNTVIPNTVTAIRSQAFSGCTGLTEVTIPASVTKVELGAFMDCTGLTSIVVEANNTVYDSKDNCNAIIETATNCLIAGCQNTVIPNSVTIIGGGAFYGASFTSIVIPESVEAIGEQAFANCRSLLEITIPEAVTRIGFGTFSNCKSLKEVTIGSSVTNIDSYAFSNCPNLALFTSLSPVPQRISSSCFEGINPNAILRVPDVEAYKNSDWAQYFSEIVDLSYDDIDDVEIEPNRNDAPAIIYDLCGRRVMNPVKGQIYIVAGRAVVM